MRRLLASLGVIAALIGYADARDITVGPGAEYQTLAAAVRGSAPGDRLVLRPGAYIASDLTVPHDLIVEGNGGVLISSPKAVAKGLFVPQADFTVRNVTLMGAAAPDKNGAGIRFEGDDLLVEDATFTRNEDGILATGAMGGRVTIRRSLFQENGHGDGYSHAVYQANGAQLLVEDSRFVGTRVGHHVKSLAPLVVVTRSTFDDAQGRTSYVVDATGGGRLIVTQNEITRQASADQNTLVNYDTSRGGALGQVTFTDNVVTTHKRRTRSLRNPEGAPVTMTANVWRTAGRGGYAGSLEQQTALPKEAEPSLPARTQARGGPPAALPPAPISEAAIARLTPQQQRAVRRLAGDLDRAPVQTGAAAPRPRGLLTTFGLGTPTGAFGAYRLVPGGPGDSDWLTFGAPFAPGVMPTDARVSAMLDGAPVPAQVDVLATHPDGSARHAAVTISHMLGGKAAGDLVLVPAGDTATPPPTRAAARLPIAVTVTGTGPKGAFEKTVTLGTDKRAGIWLNGPLVTERTETYALTPLLRLRADVRAFADGQERVRLTFENHETYLPGARSLSYSVAVSRGDEDVWRSPQLRHYRHSGWTTVLPGGQASHAVQYDPASLIASGAFLPFDLDIPVHASAVADAPGGPVLPGEAGPLAKYMPTTGGRPEVGPVTGWTAAWLKSQHPGARAGLLRLADIAITVPWHFEEDGVVVTPAHRPGFWADPRGTGTGGDRFPSEVWTEAPGGWTPDTPHKPDLAYPAYLITAEPAYARALAHEGAFTLTGIWPALRGPKGDLMLDLYQTRETAWSLRTLGNAAWILPDDAPQKGEFVRTLNKNLAAFPDYTYDTGPAAGVLPRYEDASTVAPWQQDFVVMSLAQEALRGSSDAKAAIVRITPYLSGRVLEAGGGVRFAAADDHVLATNRVPMQSWGQIVASSPLGDPYLGAGDGYHAVLLGALSAAYAATGDPQLALAAKRLVREPGAEGLGDPGARGGLAYVPQMGLALPPGAVRP